MNTEKAILAFEKKCTPVPDWKSAKQYIRPFLISADTMNKSISLLNDEYLSSFITNRIKMFMVLSYGECIIPLREELLKQWDVTFADIRLAMEDSMTNLLPLTQLEEHNKNGFIYFTVHHPQSLLNSVMPFYKPFQYFMQKELGETYYMAIPEQRTAVLFSKQHLPEYSSTLRNDILLTFDCSSQYLSPELIEVSDAGVLTVMD